MTTQEACLLLSLLPNSITIGEEKKMRHENGTGGNAVSPFADDVMKSLGDLRGQLKSDYKQYCSAVAETKVT